MSSIIICPKCYFHNHFTMKREGFYCPICGHKMEMKSLEDIKIEKLRREDLSDEIDNPLF